MRFEFLLQMKKEFISDLFLIINDAVGTFTFRRDAYLRFRRCISLRTISGFRCHMTLIGTVFEDAFSGKIFLS